MKKPVAYLLRRGDMIVCLGGKFIFVNENFTYVPSKSEQETLVPVDNSDWVVACRRKFGEITLNQEQETLVLEAFADRDRQFELMKYKINKMSLKDISPLSLIPKDKIFVQIMLCLTYFKALPENQEFRNKLGFALFDNNQMCLIKKVEPSEQEEIIKLFRSRFIQGIPEELKKMIHVCLLDSYESQKRKLLTLKNSKINSFVLD